LVPRDEELIGSPDHLAHELPTFIELAQRGGLDLSGVVTNTLPLDADAINAVMDHLDEFAGDLRVAITP